MHRQRAGRPACAPGPADARAPGIADACAPACSRACNQNDGTLQPWPHRPPSTPLHLMPAPCARLRLLARSKAGPCQRQPRRLIRASRSVFWPRSGFWRPFRSARALFRARLFARARGLRGAGGRFPRAHPRARPGVRCVCLRAFLFARARAC